MPRIRYVADGSNQALARFRCYPAGGRPAGGSRRYVGCRDDATRDEWDAPAPMLVGEP